MTTRLADLMLTTATATALWAFDQVTALEQTIPTITGTDEEKLVRFVAEKGALFALVLVILYFYRRDFRQSAHKAEAQANALLVVVRENITAMQELKAGTERMARAVEENNSRRRRGDREVTG